MHPKGPAVHLPRLSPLAALCPLVLLLTGCTAVGMMAGGAVDERHTGTPVALEQAAEIEPGTPLQVGLADGGYVRGVHLGVASIPARDSASARPAIRLGVGNRMLIDRLFERHTSLAAPTHADVPDTLVLPLDSVRDLRIPTAAKAARQGAALGAAADIGIFVWLAWLAAAGALVALGVVLGGGR